MKTRKLSFVKLLCFKYKFNLLFLDVVCIFLAVVFSCICLQYAVVAPSQEVINLCEHTLLEYLENPAIFSPPINIYIILKENTITAAMPRAFTFLNAVLIENETFQIITHVNWCAFLATYLFGFAFGFVFWYVLIEFCFLLITNICKILFKLLKKSKIFAYKKFLKLKDNFERKQNQKGIKEYEIPRLKEIYQLGYNIGHADGIAEGVKMGKSDLTYMN